MQFTRQLRLVVFSAVFGLSVLHSQVPANRYKEQLDPALDHMLREQHIPGLAIGIVQDGSLVYSRGFGLMNLDEPGKPVTPETLFHMASITKLFVGTSVIQLYEQGKVDLDAPIVQYLPYFQLKDPRHRSIKVRDMLTHTSGMPDVDDYHWNKPQYDDGALERYVRSLRSEKLLWDPGTRFAYSNMTYEVLGDLIAKVSGVSFEDYVEAHILKPLGMTSSTLLIRKADPALLAAGYRKTKAGPLAAVPHYPYNREHTPSSNLHSNVVDMARWAMANLNRGSLDGTRIVRSDIFDLLWKPARETAPGIHRHIGISWFLSEMEGEQAASHAGGDDGFRTLLVLLPARRIAIVLMSNCEHAPVQQIAKAALRAYHGQEVQAEDLTAK